MQFQRLVSDISFLDVPLDSKFPVSIFHYVQGHQDLRKLHYHNAFEIGLCLEGSGLFFIDHNTYTFHAGDLSFIFPHQPHIAQSPDELPSKWYFMTVDLGALFGENAALVNSLLSKRGHLPPIITSDLSPDLQKLFLLIATELEQKQTGYAPIVADLLHCMLLKVMRCLTTTVERSAFLSTDFTFISPALNYISSHYGENITMQQLADLCHLSETHFRCLFKKITHKSPFQYLTHVRLQMAQALLASSNLTILHISQMVGYQTLSSFNRSFRQVYGQSPSTFRKETRLS